MSHVSSALKQAWWAPVAALLVLAQCVLALMILFGGGDTGELIAGAVIATVGALTLSAGLWTRLDSRRTGNLLIVVGALLGVFWFWSLILPALGLIVLVGLATTALQTRAPARARVQSPERR